MAEHSTSNRGYKYYDSGDGAPGDDVTDWSPGFNATIQSLDTDVQQALDDSSSALSGLAGKSDVGHTHTLTDITDAGTAAAADTTDFDANGAASTAQTNAEGYTDSQIAALNLGTAAQADTGDFDAAGSAAAAQAAAESFATAGDVTTLAAAIAAIPTTSIGNGILPGTGGFTFVSGRTFRVSAATYYINKVQYTSSEQTVTVGAGDAINPRFDALVLDTGGTLSAIAGTPAATPSYPDIDFLLYCVVTYVRVDANVTSLSITTESVYAENTEWTSSTSASHVDAASTSNPHGGTKDIEFTAAVADDFVRLTRSSSVAVASLDKLAFFFRNKASWPNPKSVAVTWYLGTVKVGQSVALANGKYAISLANVTTYQQVVIPMGDFALPAGQSVDRVEFKVVGGSSAIGFYLDDIVLTTAATTIIIMQPVAVATSSVPGVVKTDITEGDPVVYTKTTMTTLLAAKPTAVLSTDGTLAANSDANVASQKAVKTYADTKYTLADNTIVAARLSATATSKFFGRKTASGGAGEELSASDAATILGTTVKSTESIIVAVGDETTAITTGTAKVTFRMPYAFTLTDVRASLTTASSSGNPAVDINEGGASIFSVTLTIDSGETTSTTATTAYTFSDTSLADDAEMTIDIDTAGTGAKGLKVTLIGHRT